LELVLKYFDDFTPTQLEQFAALEDLYKDWNSKINVISRKDIESLYEKHVLHSLAIATLADFQPGMQVIDIGTGGGFPGIPLAIFYPEVQFHLVDSIAKKLKVVTSVAESIGLKNVTTQHTRAEDIVKDKFNFYGSKQVQTLKGVWGWSKTLVKKQAKCPKPNGLICWKGGDLTQEIFESGVKPNMIHIYSLFHEPFFQEKHLLHVAK